MTTQLARPSADAATRITYEFARLESFTAWWHLALLVATVVALLIFVVSVYRRDCAEAGMGYAFVLGTLRMAVMQFEKEHGEDS